jgi:hypothetical protein
MASLSTLPVSAARAYSISEPTRVGFASSDGLSLLLRANNLAERCQFNAHPSRRLGELMRHATVPALRRRQIERHCAREGS